MEEALPNMVDDRVKELTKTQVSIYVAQGLIMERQQSQADVAKMIANAIQQERENLWAKITLQINNAITNHIPSHVDSSVRNYMSGHILHVLPTQASQLALKIKFEGLHASHTPCRSFAIRPRDQDDPHDDAHPKGENSAKRQKTSEHGTYVFGESSSGQVNESEPGPPTSGNQEQLDDYDFWTDTYATDDDELPAEKVSQELVEEMSETIDEAKLRKVVDEMLRQRCTSGDEHQYHIDQMQNFLKNDIVWESRKEILSLPFPQKPTLVIQSCQRDSKAPTLSLVNQDLLYLKKGNSEPEKIVLSLHKFLANPHAKIFYIKRQKEPVNPKEEVYLNSKIVQVIKTYGELGHGHKFVTKIIARRENGSIVSITEPDYKNLNKNDIEDMYLLCINGNVGDYAEIGLLWLLSVFIKSTVIWEKVHDFQLHVESYQLKNNKKEMRVTRHQEVHKFCDATLKRVLEGLKSYNNDVTHGYVTPSLSKKMLSTCNCLRKKLKIG
ncbi:hypothetical protein Tco_0296742 [Tanacetum coccineum]